MHHTDLGPTGICSAACTVYADQQQQPCVSRAKPASDANQAQLSWAVAAGVAAEQANAFTAAVCYERWVIIPSAVAAAEYNQQRAWSAGFEWQYIQGVSRSCSSSCLFVQPSWRFEATLVAHNMWVLFAPHLRKMYALCCRLTL